MFYRKRYLNGPLIYKVYAYCQAYHVFHNNHQCNKVKSNLGNSCSHYPAGNKIGWKILPEQIELGGILCFST